MSDFSRLARTTAVRIALRYVLIYVLLVGAALAVFYWATGHYVDAQLYAGMEEDFQSLRDRYDRDGSEGLAGLMRSRSESAATEGRFYLLVDKNGRTVSGNLLGLPPEDPLPLDAKVHVVWVEDDIIPLASYDDDAYWPVIGTVLPDGSRLVVARSVDNAEALQLYSLYALLALLAVIVFLALTMGLLIGSSILKRIDAISNTAHHIMAGDLGQRMPVSARGDEFDTLSQRLNQMLERIEQLLKGMREITDNVAHDLRSPLTRLRNRLEVTLLQRRDETEYRAAMQDAIRDAESLLRTFNALLQVSQAEAGTVRAAMTRVDAAQLVREVAELYAPAMEDAALQLQVDADQPVTVSGNRNLLAQAIGNLLDNAIKFTPAGGTVRLRAAAAPGGSEISVSDTGPGIPAPDRQRVTERFVRLDPTGAARGNGLGLSLVDAIARQHGATLLLEDNEPGLRAVIRFQGCQQHRPDRNPAAT
jgi:signal transduction histidine kinase